MELLRVALAPAARRDCCWALSFIVTVTDFSSELEKAWWWDWEWWCREGRVVGVGFEVSMILSARCCGFAQDGEVVGLFVSTGPQLSNRKQLFLKLLKTTRRNAKRTRKSRKRRY